MSSKEVATSSWPRAAHTAGNAGVVLVGHSSEHGGVPCVILGGRLYNKAKKYMYTDFGGGVDRKKGFTPQQGAFREFAEELFSQTGDEATATANDLCAKSLALVGGTPFVHNNRYVMFVVTADDIVEAMGLAVPEGQSAIDHVFASATQNSELTSVALFSVEELLRAALADGIARPLSVRHLDGDETRSCDEIKLRELLVDEADGPRGSISTIRDALEGFAPMVTKSRKSSKGEPPAGYPSVGGSSSSSKATRWGNSKKGDNDKVDAAIDAEIVKARKVTLQDAELLKCRHGDSFTSLGKEAEAWIETSFAEHGKGEKILAKLGQLTKPNEEHYYAALLTFKDLVLASKVVDISRDAKFEKSGRNIVEGRSQNSTEPRPSVFRSQNSSAPRPFVFDMETGDPDDVLTLLFLASHPDVDLRAVTITPGSQEQVALVRWLLQQLNLEHIRLGAQMWPDNATKNVNLTTLFYRGFGRSPDGKPECERADQVLLDSCDENVTLVTGAPLHNLGDALRLDGFKLGLLVAQGGFAGEGVVPQDMQMDKFRGMRTCPTWNFGGNIKAAEAALASTCIARKICVSKNVCHSVVYDMDWHAALQVAAEARSQEDPHSRRAIALSMMHKAMDEYLRHKPGGKKLHDPLALAVALNEAVCELVEVELFCEKGKWGSRLSPGSNIWISIAYDAAASLATLLA